MSKMQPPGPPPGRPPSKASSSSVPAHDNGVLLPNGMILPMMPGLSVAVPRGPDAPSAPDPLIPKAPPPAPLPEEDAPALPDEPHPDGPSEAKEVQVEEPKKKKKKRHAVEGLASNKNIKKIKTGVTVYQNMTEELTVRGERDGVIAAKRAKEMKNALPPGWVAQKSKSTGKIYYVHAKTKQTTWEKPKA